MAGPTESRHRDTAQLNPFPAIPPEKTNLKMNTLNQTELSTVFGGEDDIPPSFPPYLPPPLPRLPSPPPPNLYAAPGVDPALGIELAR